MGEKLFDRATNNFSNEKLALSHVEIYNSVISDFYNDKKYDVSLSGYYGFKNCGDDALLHAIIDDLKEQKPDIRINVFSMRPKLTRREYAVDSSNRFNVFSLVNRLKNTKLLINGGGSLIQDATSSKSLWYYLNVIKLAKKLGCKVFVYANGIGPIKDKNLKFASEITNLADYITLREKSSLSEIERMGISMEKVEVTADPAISLEPAGKNKIDAVFEDMGLDADKKIIGVSVRDWDKNDPGFFTGLASYLDELSERDFEILFIPMKTPDDEKASLQVMSYMKNKAFMTPSGLGYSEVIGVISKTHIMLGMRLHTLIFSVASGVPVVGIEYDPKIMGFLEYAKIDKCVNSENFIVDDLKKYTEEIIDNYDIVKGEVEANSKSLSGKAKQTAKMCINLLNGEEIK
jgi:polysaccharide pyruvyl transferase CsaB